MPGRAGGICAALFLTLSSLWMGAARAEGTPAYQKACTAAGVPLPPPFGVPNGTGGTKQNPLWVSTAKGGKPLTVPNTLVFDGSNGPNWTTEVWVYRRPEAEGGGMCIALPRIAGGVVELLGVICQSAVTKDSKTVSACFFDNVNMKPPPPRLTGRSIPDIPIGMFEGADQLAENCTACHIGNNAFLVIPDTAEAQETTSVPDDVFYTPISGATPRPGWVNEAMPQKFTIVSKTGDKSYMLSGKGSGCQSCHGLSRPSKRYCGYLSLVLAGRYPDGTLLMPPGETMLTAAEQNDVTALKAYCAAILASN